jgi:hypothetical protein
VPGTPHHALGGPWTTYAVAGGFAYAAVYLSLWALVAAVFWRFAVRPTETPFLIIGVLGTGAGAAVLQSALAVYLYARWELLSPIVGLFVASLVCGYLLLFVGGESGAMSVLFLWSATIAPPAAVGIAVISLVETGFREAVGWTGA